MKKILISILSFISGCISMGLYVKYNIDAFNEEQIANYQLYAITNGRYVASGKGEHVIELVRHQIENVICRNALLQSAYRNEYQRRKFRKEILSFYTALEEEIPPHVSQWLEDGTLTYTYAEEAIVGVIDAATKHTKEAIYYTQTFRNISNVRWENVSATAVLYDSNNNLIDEITVEHDEIVEPLEGVVFEFDFPRPNTTEDWIFDVHSVDIYIDGKQVEPAEGGNG